MTPVRSVQPVAPVSQDLLATEAVAHLERAGYRATSGTFGDLTTAEVALAGGLSMVLVPMVETLYDDLDTPDVDLWHVLVRDAGGTYLEVPDGADQDDACPSVLWAARMGVDPAAAVLLVRNALADDDVCAHFGLSV
ncbi:hypothetical protein PGN05_15145 [Geodermatophilus sp. CPCC 206100]